MEGREPFPIAPGMTLVFPANTRHWFRALGARPLKTFGLHASPHRIVIEHEDDGKVVLVAPVHSILAPDTFTTSAHFSTSPRRNLS